MAEHIRRTKAYKVVLSKGEPIQIDEEEVLKVIESANKGEIAVVKRGVINPSYMVSIEEDKERVGQWLKETGYGDGQGEQIRQRGIKGLKPIFSESHPLYGALKESMAKNAKQIGITQKKQLTGKQG